MAVSVNETIGNATAFDRDPSGVTTETEASPGCAIRAALTGAVSVDEERNVVGSGAPFQRTDDPRWKFAPETVSVNAGVPATADGGMSAVTTGRAARIRVTPTVACDWGATKVIVSWYVPAVSPRTLTETAEVVGVVA